MSSLKSLTQDTFDIEVSETSGTVMVDFWAPWCGPCKRLTPIIEAIANEAAGKFQVFAVNVDDEPELAKRFGIRGIPAILVFKNGKLDKTQVGSAPKAKLLELVE